MRDTDTTLDWQALIDDHVTRRADPERTVHERYVPDVNLPLSEVTTFRTINVTDVDLKEPSDEPLEGPIDLLEQPEPDGSDAGMAVGVILDIEQA